MTEPAEGLGPELERIDEELGSPVARFEHAWLVGVAVGVVAIALLGRRRRRRRRALDSPDNLYH